MNFFVQKCPEVFCTKVVLKDFGKFLGKYLCQSLCFNKVVSLIPGTLLKERLCYKCFPVNFPKFLRTSFFTEHLRWLLLSGKYLFNKSKQIHTKLHICSHLLKKSLTENLFFVQCYESNGLVPEPSLQKIPALAWIKKLKKRSCFLFSCRCQCFTVFIFLSIFNFGLFSISVWCSFLELQ